MGFSVVSLELFYKFEIISKYKVKTNKQTNIQSPTSSHFWQGSKGKMSASVKKLMSIWAGAPIPNHHCSLLSTWLSVLTYKEYHPIRSGCFVCVHCWIQVPITVVDSHSVITITFCITVLYSGVLLTISNAFNLHFQTVISDHNQAIRKMFSGARSLCNLWKLKKKKNFPVFFRRQSRSCKQQNNLLSFFYSHSHL